MSFQISSAAFSGLHHLAASSRICGPFAQIVAAFVAGQDHGLQRHAVGGGAGLDAHRMADRAAAELQHHVFAEIVEQLVHLAGMDAAGGDRHHLVERGPVLVEEQAVLERLRRVGLPQRVVEAAGHERIALELADHGAGMDVVDAGEPHPFGDDAEVHAVVLLPRIGRVAGAVQVQDHVVPARPLGHRLDRGVADHEVDHDDHRAELLGELGALVHVLHGAGGDVEVVALDLAGLGLGAVDASMQ